MKEKKEEKLSCSLMLKEKGSHSVSLNPKGDKKKESLNSNVSLNLKKEKRKKN